MKKGIIVFAAVFLMPVILIAQDEPKAKPASETKPAASKPGFETQKQKVSYAIGWDIGSNMKRQNIDIDSDKITIGIKDALSGAKSVMTEEEMKQAMDMLREEMQAKQMKERSEATEKNKAEGEAFLAKNKNKKGVKTTASGLQYKVIVAGTGEKPKAADTVKVNYKGTLINGKEFDSSYKRGQPASFGVGQVIPGWTEGLQLMKVGSKYEFYIPSNIAYGERGTGADIGPNATLIFTVELLEIEKK